MSTTTRFVPPKMTGPATTAPTGPAIPASTTTVAAEAGMGGVVNRPKQQFHQRTGSRPNSSSILPRPVPISSSTSSPRSHRPSISSTSSSHSRANSNGQAHNLKNETNSHYHLRHSSYEITNNAPITIDHNSNNINKNSSSSSHSGSNNNNTKAPSTSTASATTPEKSGLPPRQHQHPPENLSVHVHRQNHNPSKLPAFRFTDLRKDSLGLNPVQPHSSPPTTSITAFTNSPTSPTPTSVIPTRPRPSVYSANSTAAECIIDIDAPALIPASLSLAAGSSNSSPNSSQPIQSTPDKSNHKISHIPAPTAAAAIPAAKNGSSDSTIRPPPQEQHQTQYNKQVQLQNPSDLQSSRAAPASEEPPQHIQQPLTQQPMHSFDPSSQQLSTFKISHANPELPSRQITRNHELPPKSSITHRTSSPVSSSSPPILSHKRIAPQRSSSHLEYPSSKRRAASVLSSSTQAIAGQDLPSNKVAHRRLTTSSGSNGFEASRSSPTKSLTGEELAPNPSTNTRSTKEWAQGQRELLLPQTVDLAAKPEEKKRSRPPVSYRPPTGPESPGAHSSTSAHALSGARVVIPPIRSFRSSVSRKSATFDMLLHRTSCSDGEDVSHPNPRDRTLRVLEGRAVDDASTDVATDVDATSDIFMQIAREDPNRQTPADDAPTEDRTIEPRPLVTRHRCPSSAANALYFATSPPEIKRRLSESSRPPGGGLAERSTLQQISRALDLRMSETDEQVSPRSNSNLDTMDRVQAARTSLRPSPMTTGRSQSQDSLADASARASRHRATSTSQGLARSHGSSPLVPRSSLSARQESQNETTYAVEAGTESSNSTAAVSMVWDELDGIRSRVNRIELNAKMPSNSAAPPSRVSDEWPPTSTTTMSLSPQQRAPANAYFPTPDAALASSRQRDTHPLLMSALAKTKGVVGQDVYRAIESAATDAVSLSVMMGKSGQPGPVATGLIPSADGTVTDRQLRRKAESVCRSLTELCLALGEEVNQPKAQLVTIPAARDHDSPISPMESIFAGLNRRRRPSASNNVPATAAKLESSRAMVAQIVSGVGQRRGSAYYATLAASPRYASLTADGTAVTTTVAGGRQSSLLISRSRRAGTEEPEDQAASLRPVSILRTRRAYTEEPEDGRKTSQLHTRAPFVFGGGGGGGGGGGSGVEDEPPRFRAPSRAFTEIGGGGASRALTRDRPAPTIHTTEGSSSSGALSQNARSRIVSSSLGSRLAPPVRVTNLGSNRRFLDRLTPEREGLRVSDKLYEERSQRQLSLSQTAILNSRAASNTRRSREPGNIGVSLAPLNQTNISR